MEIAIAGGTGTVGRLVADVLEKRGHTVRVLSRGSPTYPVDLTTGAGLDRALAGCDAVVDAANSNASTKAARQTLVGGTDRLLAAAERTGVGHHVCVSIVNCDRVPLGYYRVKTAQEQCVRGQERVPWTIVRATQFHELLAGTFFEPVARLRLLPLPSAPIQPIAAAEVAAAVADVAEAAPRRGVVSVAGPEIADLREFGRSWRRATGRRVLQLPLVLPGGVGRALRAGALTEPAPDVRGGTTFGAWLADRYGPDGRA